MGERRQALILLPLIIALLTAVQSDWAAAQFPSFPERRTTPPPFSSSQQPPASPIPPFFFSRSDTPLLTKRFQNTRAAFQKDRTELEQAQPTKDKPAQIYLVTTGEQSTVYFRQGRLVMIGAVTKSDIPVPFENPLVFIKKTVELDNTSNKTRDGFLVVDQNQPTVAIDIPLAVLQKTALSTAFFTAQLRARETDIENLQQQMRKRKERLLPLELVAVATRPLIEGLPGIIAVYISKQAKEKTVLIQSGQIGIAEAGNKTTLVANTTKECAVLALKGESFSALMPLSGTTGIAKLLGSLAGRKATVATVVINTTAFNESCGRGIARKVKEHVKVVNVISAGRNQQAVAFNDAGEMNSITSLQSRPVKVIRL